MENVFLFSLENVAKRLVQSRAIHMGRNVENKRCYHAFHLRLFHFRSPTASRSHTSHHVSVYHVDRVQFSYPNRFVDFPCWSSAHDTAKRIVRLVSKLGWAQMNYLFADSKN